MAFSCPSLPMEDLVAVLQGEMKIACCLENLQKPSAEWLMDVYQQLLEFACEFEKEDLQQIQFAGMDILQYAQLHEDSIPVLMFMRYLRRITELSHVGGVRLLDVLKPDVKRTRLILSALVNFCRFKEERAMAFGPQQEQADALDERKSCLMEGSERLRCELLQQQARSEQEVLPQIQEADRENAANERELDAINRQQAALQAEIDESRGKQHALATQLSGADERMGLLRQRRVLLHGQIVQSPEVIQKEVLELGQRIKQQKERILERTEERRRLAGRVQELTAAERALRTHAETLKWVRDKAGRVAELRAQLDEGVTEHLALARRDEERTNELEAGRAMVARASERLENQKGSQREEEQRFDAQDQEAAAQRSELELRLRENQLQAEFSEARCRELHDAIARDKSQHEARVHACKRQLTEVRTGLESYSQQLQGLLLGRSYGSAVARDCEEKEHVLEGSSELSHAA